MNDDTLIYYGGDVKALGSGRVGGYLVRWGAPESADIQGDYFTPQTDFWSDIKSCVGAVYHHGLGGVDDLAKELKAKRIGRACFCPDAIGLVVDGQLNIDDPAVAKVYAKAERGELGWSSGSVSRLVERGPEIGGKTSIKTWPIIEATLSPRPVDPRNRVIAIKSLHEYTSEGDKVALSLVERAEALVADAEDMARLFGKAADQRLNEGRTLTDRKRAAVKALADAFASIHDATRPRPGPERLADLQRRLLLDRIKG
jgi:hypothetical protein